MTTAVQIDEKKVEEVGGRVFGALTGLVTSGSIYLGDKLGLYRAMRDQGPLTVPKLAEMTGCSERWLTEWLRGQVANGMLDYHGNDTFELSAEAALVLADEMNPAASIGFFDALPHTMSLLHRIEESFRTGVGFTYDSMGPDTARLIDRELGPWNRTVLVPEAIPLMDGMVARLQGGIRVADVGCGSAAGIIAMAQAFPNSEFHGYDNSKNALARAKDNIAEAGVSNVQMHDSDHDRLPEDGSFDLILCLDCLHDMTHPDLAAAAIWRSLKSDGTWFIVDISGYETFEENLEKHPLAAMAYNTSMFFCLSSSTSEPGTVGYGTFGLPEGRMRAMAQGAGFSRFRRIEIEHPFNAYYEVKP